MVDGLHLLASGPTKCAIAQVFSIVRTTTSRRNSGRVRIDAVRLSLQWVSNGTISAAGSDVFGMDTEIEISAAMKKTSITHLSKMKTGSRSPVRAWHNGCDIEIHGYARSLRRAAKTLEGKLDVDRSAKTEWDICPIVLLYRQAIKLHLKLLAGEGSNFVPSPTDPISLSTTHSLRWLAQIVCQIIKAVGWEGGFKCDGVAFAVRVQYLGERDRNLRSGFPSDSVGKDSEFDFGIPANIRHLPICKET
jgi:hypothetical protein